MNLKQRWGAVFAACGVLAALGTVSGHAAAVTYRVMESWAGCAPTDSGATSLYTSGGNNGTANTLVLVCPLEDTTNIKHADIADISLTYNDANSTQSVSGYACMEFENAAGGVCGNPGSSSNGIGSVSIPLSGSATFNSGWPTSLHFSYVMVFVPPKVGSSISYLKGLYYYK